MVSIPSNEMLGERLRRYGFHTRQAKTTGLWSLFERLTLSELDLMTIRDLVRYGPDPSDDCLIGILGVMFSVLGQGSLCLRLDQDQLQNSVPDAADPAVSALFAGFIRRLDEGQYDNLIDRNGSAGFTPMVLDETTGRRLLYFQKFHRHEQRLKQRLAAFLSTTWAHQLSEDAIQAVIDRIYCDDAVIRNAAGGDPIVKDPFQVDAIRAALKTPLLVISGGPGTGKTSLLVNTLRALVRTGADPSRILLAAPTGRAAQRMGEAMTANLATIAEPDPTDRQLERLRGTTLHRLLAYRGRSAGFVYGRNRPLAADVIAVDEVSMVDVVMMDRLFQAIDPARTRVILLGDKDQLPSVEAGAVLADLNPAAGGRFASHVVMLRNVYRSSGRLLELAQAINAGQAIPLSPVGFTRALNMEAGDWGFVDAEDAAVMVRHLNHWFMRHYVEKRPADNASYVELVHQLRRLGDAPESADLLETLFAYAYRSRILSVLRHGHYGAQGVNAHIAAGLRPYLDPNSNPDTGLFNGALIMITRNDYARGLFNGDVGLVIRHLDDGMYWAYFKRSDGPVAFPAGGLPDWNLAFAMTVHKSQGAEFENTLLLLPEDPEHRLLTREIVYTAATRASRRLIVYGKAEVFQAALKRKIQRQSGLLV